MTSTVFDLPERLAAKTDPELIDGDERHFDAIATSLQRALAETSDALDAERRSPGGHGTRALDRDLEIHRLTARLRTLRRYGLDLCLGRFEPADGSDPVYVGRLGIGDGAGGRLLVDWRSPAAEPFFGATHANPMGLASRRRYRWTHGRITDYWDEVFTAEGLERRGGLEGAALDDQSAFIASLGASRSERMRDVLGTIQADQDAIIRAGSRGPLVVDGGPGTGKTVVALHRTAYLLYSDPRLGHRRGGVLFVGPSRAYLDYVADVLPSLGEEGVQTCTLRDLVPEGAWAPAEHDPAAARLKASSRIVDAVDAAVASYERPPRRALVVETRWLDVHVDAADWEEAFGAREPADSHNDARDEIWSELLAVLADRHADDDVPQQALRRALAQDPGLRAAFDRAWPLLDPVGVVADLWSVPSYLQRCAPWLDAGEVAALQRDDPRAWTASDLPLLDAARRAVGDPEASRTRIRREAALAVQRERMDRVVDELIAADDSELGLMKMLRVEDAKRSLVDESELPTPDPDELAGPFAHIVVDEAQELTDAEWQMLLRRCPSRSFTIVGDRAQARHGFTEPWRERLERAGLGHAELASLTINYRTPEEIMREAEPVIRTALPDANVPTSVRSTGIPVLHAAASDLDRIVADWLDGDPEGSACVISTGDVDSAVVAGSASVRVLTPELSKGLEFDLVALVDPDRFGTGIEGAVDRYVAMTRATRRLVVLAGG
ncbi:RNA polymerase recycling motor ATPase HelR [Agromyces sp. NPDC058110]|uniref:RNA polymerase recycling motor ATPase HelR n=1 Tax=Agromyces sp. NPDC058110 TaxID=3346345 RepID=UPI0036DEF4D4